MDGVKLALISHDLSKLNRETIVDYVNQYQDCDIIVFPEYLLELEEMALPEIKDKFIVFGSKIEDEKNVLYINNDGHTDKLEKLKMTPFEHRLLRGSRAGTFEFKGVRIGVMICFDSEFPQLVRSFRGIDLLLVPSATETVLGYERVNRCSSARSVELGCASATCHLIGESDNEYVDNNVGECNLYLPSQSLFLNMSRCEINPHVSKGPVVRVFDVPIKEIREQRTLLEETNPSIVD